MGQTAHPVLSPPPAPLALFRESVHLWHIPLEHAAVSADASATLDPEENRRAAAFYFEHDRKRYVRAHLALRRILARYLALAPSEIRFTLNAFGKPSVAGELAFNLSHAGEFALVAVARGGMVGADIEQIRGTAADLDIARRYFSRPEFDDLAAEPPAERPTAFFTLWTRKEAVIKAVGNGLSHPLDTFDVSPARGDQVRWLTPAPTQPTAHWLVKSWFPAPGYVASLALASQVQDPTLYYILWA